MKKRAASAALRTLRPFGSSFCYTTGFGNHRFGCWGTESVVQSLLITREYATQKEIAATADASLVPEHMTIPKGTTLTVDQLITTSSAVLQNIQATYDAIVDKGQVQEAHKYVEVLEQNGLQPTPGSFEKLLLHCLKKKDTDLALVHLEFLYNLKNRPKLAPDASVLDQFLKICYEKRDLPSAGEFWNVMSDMGVRPTGGMLKGYQAFFKEYIHNPPHKSITIFPSMPYQVKKLEEKYAARPRKARTFS